MKIANRWIVTAGFVAATALVGPLAVAKDPAKPASAQVKRGEYLVSIAACHDCHTPVKMGPNGPEPDMTRALSGHSAQMVLPPAPKLPPGPWIGTVAATMTGWSGPWGTSFTANLTPDKETGLGNWTERNFIDTIRSGRKLGRGRPLLPPMPWPVYRNMTDEDLKAVFAYLQTVPAVKNKVPDPIVPAPVVVGQK
jgi:mono/diheme cytochrome c family protein